MPKLYVSASSQRSNVSNITVPLPATMACWFKPSALGADVGLVAVSFDGSGNNSSWIGLTASDTATCITRDTAQSGAASTGTVVLGKWHLIVGVLNSLSDRRVYLDGSSDTDTDTGARTPSEPVSFILGARRNGGSWCNGSLGPCAIWTNFALLPKHIDKLANGMPFEEMHPAQQLGAWNLDHPRALNLDLSGNANHATDTNGPILASADAPPINTFGGGQLFKAAAAAAAVYEQLSYRFRYDNNADI